MGVALLIAYWFVKIIFAVKLYEVSAKDRNTLVDFVQYLGQRHFHPISELYFFFDFLFLTSFTSRSIPMLCACACRRVEIFIIEKIEIGKVECCHTNGFVIVVDCVQFLSPSNSLFILSHSLSIPLSLFYSCRHVPYIIDWYCFGSIVDLYRYFSNRSGHLHAYTLCILCRCSLTLFIHNTKNTFIISVSSFL